MENEEVKTSDPDACNPDVFSKGQVVGIFSDISKRSANTLCEQLSIFTGWQWDWNYAAGRVILRCLKD